jgi:proline iminopeptidase
MILPILAATAMVNGLFTREVGRGPPLIVLHGGPDFDHRYLLPDLDRLSDSYRLVYYDQRGRGRSAGRAEDVTLESEMRDLDDVRQAHGLRSTALLGHSWGAVLALEYAIRHPDRVSRLILMNPAPASAADVQELRAERQRRLGADFDRLQAIARTDAYKKGEPDAVVAYYRIHFKPALARPGDLDKLMSSMGPTFDSGVLRAREIEQRLYRDTWQAAGYDLMPKLAALQIPTLVIWGDHDFIPAAAAAHIAGAIPQARLVTIARCGHFSYLECPADVRRVIDDFFARR